MSLFCPHSLLFQASASSLTLLFLLQSILYMAAGLKGILLKEIITLLLMNRLWLPSALRVKPTHTALDCAGDGGGGVEADSKDSGEQSANSAATDHFGQVPGTPCASVFFSVKWA